MMARSEAQRDKDAAGEAMAAERMGNLMGFNDSTVPPMKDPGADHVGWCQWSPATLKGVHHKCRNCQPGRPHKGHWEKVTRASIKATMTCSECLVKLETVAVP